MAVWHGIRVTMACGHMRLEVVGRDIHIGQLSACWICPPRTVNGREETRARMIVDLAGVDAPAKPPTLTSEQWF